MRGMIDDRAYAKGWAEQMHISCLTLIAVLSPSLANSAACPTQEDLGAGIVLTGADGRTVLHARSASPTEVEVETLNRQKSTSKIVYRDGLFPLTSAHANGQTTYEYQTDVSAFRLAVGSRLSYAVKIRTAGKPDILQISEMTAVKSDHLRIGDCNFPVILVERTNSFSSPELKGSVVLAYFSAELQMPLRTRIRFADGRERDFVLSQVSAKR